MKLFQKPLTHYTALIGLYLILTQVLPADKFAMRAYDLTAVQYHLILLLVAIPFIGIWFAAFYSFSRLQAYARAIKNSNEGHDFRQLATGSGWLAYALPLIAIVSIILNSIANQYPNFHPTAIIASNYLGLFLALIAFTILSNCVRRLSIRAQVKLSLGAARSLIAVFAVIGISYGYFSFHYLSDLALLSSNNIYFLPVWLVVSTIIVPYLYAWYIGLLAAYEIMLYAKQVKGVIYRQALQYLASGLTIVIVSSIALQFIFCVITSTGSAELNCMLLGVFIVELLSALGFGLIAIGARRLQRIEEV